MYLTNERELKTEMKIGEFIKIYREEHNLSQRQFASTCNISNGYISMLEKGCNPKTGEPITPSFQQLQKIAKGMGISLHSLLSSVDDIDVDISVSEQKETPAPESGLSPARQEVIKRLRGLTEDEIRKIIVFIDAAIAMLPNREKDDQ